MAAIRLNTANWIMDRVIFRHRGENHTGRIISVDSTNTTYTIQIGSFLTVPIPVGDVIKRIP